MSHGHRRPYTEAGRKRALGSVHCVRPGCWRIRQPGARFCPRDLYPDDWSPGLARVLQREEEQRAERDRDERAADAARGRGGAGA